MSFELADVGYTHDDDNSTVWVVDARANKIFALGMPGSAIWLEALRADSPASLVTELCAQYGWDPDVIEVDVMDFVKDLVTRGWLKEKVQP